MTHYANNIVEIIYFFWVSEIKISWAFRIIHFICWGAPSSIESHESILAFGTGNLLKVKKLCLEWRYIIIINNNEIITSLFQFEYWIGVPKRPNLSFSPYCHTPLTFSIPSQEQPQFFTPSNRAQKLKRFYENSIRIFKIKSISIFDAVLEWTVETKCQKFHA